MKLSNIRLGKIFLSIFIILIIFYFFAPEILQIILIGMILVAGIGGIYLTKDKIWLN